METRHNGLESDQAPSKRAQEAAEDWLSNMDQAMATRLLDIWRSTLIAEKGFSRRFYQRLFRRYPAVADLFPGDMEQQAARLTATLSEAIELAPHPDRLINLLKAAGVRHHHYRVQQVHFDLMAPLIIETFKEVLGDQFSPQLESDWEQFFHNMATVMRAAMFKAKNEPSHAENSNK